MLRIAVAIYAALGFLACSSATSPRKVTVALSGAPYGIAVSPSGVAYVTLAGAGMLARADLPATSFSPVAVVGSAPTAVTFNASGTRAYVTNQFSRTVSVLDPASNTVLHVIPVTGDARDERKRLDRRDSLGARPGREPRVEIQPALHDGRPVELLA